MVALPAKDTDEGVEARVLLAECRSPAYSSYNLADATQCMRLMDCVLWNRMAQPAKFGAKGATTLSGVIKAKGQFAGFESYPNYDHSIVTRIQGMIDIANNKKDKRNLDYLAHLNAAFAVTGQPSIGDPSPGTLVAWRTAGSGTPGSGFLKHVTLLGIDFYYMA